jgi:glycosyltransferase involved in cell wall biosynthesis
LGKARAFVFAAEEDFGIAPLEAQAMGIPVIAFGKGGVLETIKGIFFEGNEPLENNTGVFFREQTVESLCRAIDFFVKHEASFTPADCRKNAERFSKERFREEFNKFVFKCGNAEFKKYPSTNH